MSTPTLAARDSDVADILSKDQIAHKKELDRFHLNIKALQYMLRHELQAISARFNIKNSIASLDPIDIGYFERDLKHISIEKRRTLEFAECRYQTKINEDLELPIFQMVERLCDDGLTADDCRITAGIGLLHLDLKRAKAYVRVMPADFQPSADAPYPFLIVTN